MNTTVLAIIFTISGLAAAQSKAQNNEWLSYYPTTKDVDSFFQSQFSLKNGRTLASYDARYLHFMGEEPLLDAVSPSMPQAFRLLIETRPDNLPIVVRLLTRTDGSGEAVTKVSRSLRNAEALDSNRTEELSPKQVDQLLGLMASSDFWSAPTVPVFNINHPIRMGEAGWTLEAANGSSYHVISRSTSTLGSLNGPVMFLLIDIGKLDLRFVEDDRAPAK